MRLKLKLDLKLEHLLDVINSSSFQCVEIENCCPWSKALLTNFKMLFIVTWLSNCCNNVELYASTSIYSCFNSKDFTFQVNELNRIFGEATNIWRILSKATKSRVNEFNTVNSMENKFRYLFLLRILSKLLKSINFQSWTL